jgi:hypothetical protein
VFRCCDRRLRARWPLLRRRRRSARRRPKYHIPTLFLPPPPPPPPSASQRVIALLQARPCPTSSASPSSTWLRAQLWPRFLTCGLFSQTSPPRSSQSPTPSSGALPAAEFETRRAPQFQFPRSSLILVRNSSGVSPVPPHCAPELSHASLAFPRIPTHFPSRH